MVEDHSCLSLQAALRIAQQLPQGLSETAGYFPPAFVPALDEEPEQDGTPQASSSGKGPPSGDALV
jgi:hypothetical protein